MAEMHESAPGSQATRRTSTGINGLDTILAGGLLARATHLLTGASGTGKTVLAQQIAYHHARQGNNVLNLTLLSESHDKMISNLSAFSFFDETLIGARIQYLSLYNEVASAGLAAFTPAVREAVLKQRAKLVIVDGISSLRDFASSRGELRKILFDFNAQLSNLGCTALLLVDDEPAVAVAPEYAIADSILRLHNKPTGLRHIRTLEVQKARATPALTGLHYFDITDAGLVIYPRIEALLSAQKKDPPPALKPSRQAFEVEGLDRMLNGGLLSGSINLLLGTPGSGKTITGLHFLHEGAKRGEKTLVLSFQHSAERIRSKSKQLGFDLSVYMDQGLVKVFWALPVERTLDEIVGQLLALIEEYQPARLLIDALSDLETLSLYPERMQGFWAALTNYFRNRQITMLGTLELNRVIGDNLDIPERPISIIADTILLLRTVELDGKLTHAISILEMRDSDFDTSVREYLISSTGLRVGDQLSGNSVLKGVARADSSENQTD
jgi:circadian clock protein KaiC